MTLTEQIVYLLSIVARLGHGYRRDKSQDRLVNAGIQATFALLPVCKRVSLTKSQIRAYRWCSPPRIGWRQCLRTARSRACRANPSRVKRESVPRCNRWRISQEFAEGVLR